MTKEKTAIKTVSGENQEVLKNEIFETLDELESSIKLSHNTERMIFQNELQLHIDKHCLQFELDKEKCKNSKLKRMNISENNFQNIQYQDENNIKLLRNKCFELSAFIKKRTNQLNKALSQVKDLKEENEILKSRLKAKNTKIKEIKKEFKDKFYKLEQEMIMAKETVDKEREMYNRSDVQVALHQQIKRNSLLIYNNNQLKSQIAYSKRVYKFNVSTQVSFADLLSNISDDEISG